MGRRALRKIDPNLELTRHLKGIEDLTPWTPGEWFAATQPIEIEVGSGKGLFMVSAAQANPGHNYLGIEIARKYARFAAARLAKRELPNAIMMVGDAQALFQEVIPSASTHAVHIYFPDPWWKKRHHKRRIMNKLFLMQVHRALKPSGKLHFWTDVQEYFDASLELIRNELPFDGPFEIPELPSEHDLDYRTHFERRMRLHDKPVYRCCFQK